VGLLLWLVPKRAGFDPYDHHGPGQRTECKDCE
jgi:hypothetical protein